MERVAYLYPTFCACIYFHVVDYGLSSSCSGSSTSPNSTITWFTFVSFAFKVYATAHPRASLVPGYFSPLQGVYHATISALMVQLLTVG